RNVCQMLVLQAKALVVFVAQTAEQFWKRKLDSLRFALVPCGGAELVAPGRGVDGFHLFDAGDARKLVPSGLDLRGCGENGDRTGGTRRFVPRGWQSAERGIDLDEKRTDMPLFGIQFSRKVADVRGLDFCGFDLLSLEPAQYRLAHHSDEVFAFLGP